MQQSFLLNTEGWIIWIIHTYIYITINEYTYSFPFNSICLENVTCHYNDVIMSAIASQITTLTIVYSTVYSGADQRKHQSSVSLAFVRGIHWWPVNSPHKGPVTRKMFPFDDVIMIIINIIHDSFWWNKHKEAETKSPSINQWHFQWHFQMHFPVP